MFITTANILDTIPAALRDRMEVLDLPGYTEEEKLEIARRYLIPRQLKENGLAGDLLRLDDGAVRTMITSYTREAGVRNLEREVASVCRAVASRVAKGNTEAVLVLREDVPDFLGSPKFIPETKARAWGPGLATGLAWTPAGGEIIFIEASKMKGKNRLTLTGQLGEVMKESATTALSYIRSRARDFNADEDFFDEHDIHIHIPAGATPKDGPSAGVAMLCALYSVITGNPVRQDVAMTGEITLRGDVLPVGGIKEKILAARRAGIKTVMLPQLNQKDLDEIPEGTRKDMTFRWVQRMEEVIDFALENGTEQTIQPNVNLD
jgi:ATP-dependent Lon protease